MSEGEEVEDDSKVKPLCSGPRRPFTKLEIQRMKDYFEDPTRMNNPKAWRDRILFYLIVITGFRGHEIGSMKWKNCYNFNKACFRESMWIPKRHMKGAHAVRVIWMSQQLKRELQLWRQRYRDWFGVHPEPDDYVVTSVRKGARAGPLCGEHIWRILKRDVYATACGGPEFDDTHIGVHSGRKYAISRRYELTNSSIDAARYAGHRHPETTMRYIAGPSSEEEQKIAEQLTV